MRFFRWLGRVLRSLLFGDPVSRKSSEQTTNENINVNQPADHKSIVKVVNATKNAVGLWNLPGNIQKLPTQARAALHKMRAGFKWAASKVSVFAHKVGAALCSLWHSITAGIAAAIAATPAMVIALALAGVVVICLVAMSASSQTAQIATAHANIAPLQIAA